MGRRRSLTPGAGAGVSPALAAAARSLRVAAVDANTAEVVTALQEGGVACLLLKGPTFSRWIYGDGTDRPYADTDLLIRIDQFGLAERTLLARGFAQALGSGDQRLRTCHAHVWRRLPEGVEVDLHWRIEGVEASSEQLWEELRPGAESISVAGVEVQGLGAAARAFHAALHAAQDGPRRTKPLEDLRRALAQCDAATWAEAAGIARRLRASDAFGTGLRTLPAGQELATRLGVPLNASVTVALRANARHLSVMLGMQQLAEAKGNRLDILWAALWPSAQLMRRGSPLARKGRLGLAAARLWRPLRLLWRAPRAVAGVLAARRQVAGRPRTELQKHLLD